MKTLILIDVQRDFLPNGSLPVPKGNEIIAVINRIMPKFGHIFATQDWHPKNHVSFGLWPEHCVQNSLGAELAEELDRERIEKVFQKGMDLKVDSYSAFFDNDHKRSTGLADHLAKLKIKKLYFAGLATDYCVLYSVLDALSLQFEVWVIQDACRPINVHEGDEEKALEMMRSKGAHVIQSSEI